MRATVHVPPNFLGVPDTFSPTAVSAALESLNVLEVPDSSSPAARESLDFLAVLGSSSPAALESLDFVGVCGFSSPSAVFAVSNIVMKG